MRFVLNENGKKMIITLNTRKTLEQFEQDFRSSGATSLFTYMNVNEMEYSVESVREITV